MKGSLGADLIEESIQPIVQAERIVADFVRGRRHPRRVERMALASQLVRRGHSRSALELVEEDKELCRQAWAEFRAGYDRVR